MRRWWARGAIRTGRGRCRASLRCGAGAGAGGEAGGEAGAVVRGPAPGSNNWAVSGARTRDGRAILANDMHLRIMTPPPWFRVQLNWGKGRFAAGVSLPGCPGVIAGSNGRVAWGFTNLTGDCEDFIRVRTDAEGRRYRFGPGAEDYEAFGSIVERIEVAGGPAEELVLRTTRWGVVTGKSWDGAPLVLRWPALDPETVNLRILGIIGAQTLEEAVECARGWWGPPQNCVMADATGRVAWVVTGWIPERRGFDGRRHADWSAEGVGWAGPVDEAKRPVVLDPADGVVFTANARPTGLEAARVLGRCWSMGDRAGRIAEVLRGGAGLTERDMLALQLDTRTPAMDFYRDVLLGAVGESETDAELAAARRAAAEWNGRADAESVGFRVLARFRGVLTERLERAVLGGAGGDGGANYWWLQDDEMFMRVLEERPAWVLARMRESSWEGAIRGTLRRSLGRASNEAERYPADWTWGRSNRVRFQHPLSLAVPWLGRVLDMPAEEQAGHVMAVRVAGPTFGASERLVVSPGREEDGILHMPGGQSGHFLSRHYRDGQGAWLRGEATALLAGPVVSGFRLEPAGARGRGPGG
ncbi:MAG: penicillin acylase family protein [Planctomycetota bacterium]|nr:penicillin acylase family protein [Planctomycetota bacterium]